MKKQNFLFSVSTCAFQVEGGRNLGGRTDSIWDEFTKRNFTIPPIGVPQREINSIEVAADLFHKYKTDVRIMKKLGLNSFVYNLDWTRIFPKNETDFNPEGIKFYVDFFEELSAAGIKPIPILFHWDTPLWAQNRGGFENKEIVNWFANYAAVCFKYLGKYCDLWFVSDENSTFTHDGYLSDYLPPQRNDKLAFVKALHNLNLVAAKSKEQFDLAKQKGELSKTSLLGIDHDWSPPVVIDNDKNVEKKYNEWFLNLFLDPNLKGKYPKIFTDFINENNLDFSIPQEDLNFLKLHRLDFIGWNYYRPAYICGSSKIDEKEFGKKNELRIPGVFAVAPKSIPTTKWGWPIDVSRLISGGVEISQRYGKDIPIMIIENGYGDFDDKSQPLIKDLDRINYLKLHLNEVLKGREFINFIGYSAWTYCDIYSPSGGYRKDYGLVSVDFNSPIKKRTPKLSYVWYKKVVETNGEELNFDEKELVNDLKSLLNDWDIFHQ